MKKLLRHGLFAAGLAAAGVAHAEITVEIHAVSAEGVGDSIGTVTAKDIEYGLLLTPDLKGIEPGLHGFHVHENPDCGPGEKEGEKVAGLAAGGHFDPDSTGSHKGPYDDSGHLGDLPALSAKADGTVTLPVLAPRLKEADLKGHSLMIHQGGDNYSDEPESLGGGGARVACGVVE